MTVNTLYNHSRSLLFIFFVPCSFLFFPAAVIVVSPSITRLSITNQLTAAELPSCYPASKRLACSRVVGFLHQSKQASRFLPGMQIRPEISSGEIFLSRIEDRWRRRQLQLHHLRLIWFLSSQFLFTPLSNGDSHKFWQVRNNGI